MKRWFRRTALLVVLALVGRTVWLVGEREWIRRDGEQVYAEATAATDVTEPDWRWDDLAAKCARVPDGRNGMDVVFRAKEQLPPPNPNPDDPLAAGEPPGPVNARLRPEYAARVRTSLAPTAPALATARTLKDYPHGGYRVTLHELPIQTLLPHVDAARQLAVYLRWDAALAADAGDLPAALDSAEALLNLGRALTDPFLISQLVRIVSRNLSARTLERILAQGEADPRRLAALQAAWAVEAEEPLLATGLRGERATLDLTYEYLLGDAGRREVLAPGAGADGWFGDYSWWLFKVRMIRDRAAILTYLNHAVAAARKPVHEQRAALTALPLIREDEYGSAARLCPDITKYATSCWRSAAQARCVVVALACERYRRDRGRWPGSPDDLVPAYLPAVPLDPFDGQPLRIKTLADGAVVYSVGVNRTDDGGETARPGDPPGPPPDEGFRLWNPDARRRPAPDMLE